KSHKAAGYGADQHGADGRRPGAGGAAGYQAAHPSIGTERGVGAAEPAAREPGRGEGSGACPDRGVDADENEPFRSDIGEEDGAGSVQPQPAEQAQKAGKQHEHGIVSWNGGGHPRSAAPSPAGTEAPG